jgi:hypothetical protein
VEDHYESAMASQALEKQWYCLVAFTGVALGSASNGDGSPSESILEALDKSGDSKDCDEKGNDSVCLIMCRCFWKHILSLLYCKIMLSSADIF